MNRKWRPNATQRAAFRERMQDPVEQMVYDERKSEKANYENWSQKSFIPTKEQYEFCMRNMYNLFATGLEKQAAESVIYGYNCMEKVAHDDIHVVNELRRKYPTS